MASSMKERKETLGAISWIWGCKQQISNVFRTTIVVARTTFAKGKEMPAFDAWAQHAVLADFPAPLQDGEAAFAFLHERIFW